MSLIGVVSWGYGCAGVDALGIYAEVSHFTEWLNQQMPDLNTCPPYSGGATLPPTTSSTTPSTTPTTPSTTPTTTPTTTPKPTTTTEPAPECENGKYPKKLQVYKKMKKVKKWTTCRNSCNSDPNCEYFKWKNHKKWQKRQCFLMKLVWQSSNGWVS